MPKERKSRADTNSATSSQSSVKSKSSQNNPSTNQTAVSPCSQSESPTSAEAMADLSLQSTEPKTEKNVRSQTERPIKRRYGVYSVVPDSEVLMPICRPDAQGTVGKAIAIYTSHFPVYDEGKNLHTRELLTDFTKPRRVKLTVNNEEKTFEFKVRNLVRQENIGNIFDFINGKTTIRPRDPIRIIETLFKQSVHDQYVL
ncbi:unnamed protein product [Rotaria sp. Silwood2]|nr:unnamed protein product [Rotaria sp. Silwood2]CAF4672008.1 unnamed protein product [Rotaria sp. Silwood2]